ncbi:MAG: type II secretion system protein [Gammaproteobacteria bacterium]
MTKKQNGFSLIELAVVLFIISLLLGGLLVPLANQLEGQQRSEAQTQLEQIREALIGFAIINGRLPCFATEADPSSPDYGEEDTSCNPQTATEDGILPWKTLGLDSGTDPWGSPRTSESDPWRGYWRYRPDSVFIDPFDLSDVDADQLRVADSNGNLLTSCCVTGSPRSQFPVAIVYSSGANLTADGENVSYEQNAGDQPTYQGGTRTSTFDDMTIWITRPLLLNRMVSAGRLP